MDYASAVAFLEKLPPKKKWSLAPTRALCKVVGVNPASLPCVIVTGTNGKGSTSAMLESILRESGLKTGFYSSPHLVNYAERIKINGKDSSIAEFCKAVSELKPGIDKYNSAASAKGAETLSTFEALTVLAFGIFQKHGVDFAVLEVGMGGRLDATNVANPIVSVVTNVSIEHADALGNTVEKIAIEKAGILRKNAVLVTAAKASALSVLKRECEKRKARLVEISHARYSIERVSLNGTRLNVFDGAKPVALETKLVGIFQAENAALAYFAAKEISKKGINIPSKAIAEGIASAQWPGRFERASVGGVPVIFDGSHNPAGAVALSQTAQVVLGKNKFILVIAVMADKDVEGVIAPLARIAARTFATRVCISRSASEKQIAKIASKYCAQVESHSVASKALAAAIVAAKKEKIPVLVAGSLYLEGELKNDLKLK